VRTSTATQALRRSIRVWRGDPRRRLQLHHRPPQGRVHRRLSPLRPPEDHVTMDVNNAELIELSSDDEVVVAKEVAC